MPGARDPAKKGIPPVLKDFSFTACPENSEDCPSHLKSDSQAQDPSQSDLSLCYLAALHTLFLCYTQVKADSSLYPKQTQGKNELHAAGSG